ncbi:hypothetical protein U9M48_002719 [Paspalum notatum var. saurae]|uniref:HAT C-terminal dimerisation domain-containing protein n=1 Tax=Paspalum notatum var. saurae TaxID=547442 RepID=A0AAQ3SK20_PASNO
MVRLSLQQCHPVRLLKCPCNKHNNGGSLLNKFEIAKDLVDYGFTPDYETWTFHGEKETRVEVEGEADDAPVGVDRMDEMLEALQPNCVRDNPGVMTHSAHSDAWKALDEFDPEFAKDVRNIRFVPKGKVDAFSEEEEGSHRKAQSTRCKKVEITSGGNDRTSQVTRRRKLRSEIWKDFEPIYDVQEGLKMMSGAVSTIRESVKYVKSSQGRKQSCALEYKRAFQSLTSEDIQYTHEPLVEEWDMARQGFGASSAYFLEVQKTFQKLFDEYSVQYSHLIPGHANQMSKEDATIVADKPWADWRQRQNLNPREKVSELDKYLEEDTISVDSEFDILQYWKMSSATYPVLACMARDILAIPASSVASESAFSSDLIGPTHDSIAGSLIGDDDDDEI